MTPNPLGIAALALLPACMDFGLAKVDDHATPDTAAPEAPEPDTGFALDTGTTPADTGAADTPADPDLGCGTFTFAWEAPFDGWIELQGEFTTPDGVVTAPWTVLAADAGRALAVEVEVCPPFAFRGEGVYRPTADADATSWACVRQGYEESYAVVGEVRFAFDDTELPVRIADDPYSDGCGVATSLE